MSLPIYNTFTEKDAVFARVQIDEFEFLLKRLKELKSDGYYFRGQSDAGWKLYTKIQRVWDDENLSVKFATVADFNEQHLIYQQKYAADKLNMHTKQRNDLADSSALQHYGAPTPFLDFTSEIDAALFFATDGMPPEDTRETSQRFSIYAWKPGLGPATASNNDMTNWETVIDNFSGIDEVTNLSILKSLSIIYIKQDSGKFLQIANERVDLQKGLFIYSPKSIRQNIPYEERFSGMTTSNVGNFCDELLIPKMTCLDVSKVVAAEVVNHLEAHGVCKDSLGLTSDDWAKQHFNTFVKEINI